jgi:hypothetical protein
VLGTSLVPVPEDAPVKPEEGEASLQTANAAPSPSGAHHPFIEGLLKELPPVKSAWASGDRAKWLQAAAQIFDLIYTSGDERITVQVG